MNLMEGFSVRPIQIESKYFYRARLNTNGKSFKNGSELWHPPAEFVRLQRFNFESSPKLYVSRNINTCIKEIRAKEGDRVTLVRLKLRPRTPMICGLEVGIAESAAYKSGVGAILPRYNPLDPRLRSGALSNERLSAIRQWLTKICLRYVASDDADSKYRVSAAICDIFFDVPQVGMLWYPSVMDPQYEVAFGENIVLASTYAAEKLEIESCAEINVHEFSAAGRRIEYLRGVSFLDDSKDILWNPNKNVGYWEEGMGLTSI